MSIRLNIAWVTFDTLRISLGILSAKPGPGLALRIYMFPKSLLLIAMLAIAASAGAFAQSPEDWPFLEGLKTLGSLVAAPTQVKINTDPVKAVFGTKYDPETQTLVLNPADNAQPTEIRQAIEAHEFGHEVYDLGMANVTPAWPRLIPDLEAANLASRTRQGELEDAMREGKVKLPKRPDGYVDWASVEKIDPAYAQVMARLGGLFRQLKVQGAYNELFGDFFAAVAKSNPNAIGSFMKPDRFDRWRDFSHHFTPEELETLRGSEQYKTDPHLLFLPSYAALWDRVSSHFGAHGENKDKVIRAVFDMLARDAETMLKQGPLTAAPDPQLLNQRLLQGIDRLNLNFDATIDPIGLQPSPPVAGNSNRAF